MKVFLAEILLTTILFIAQPPLGEADRPHLRRQLGGLFRTKKRMGANRGRQRMQPTNDGSSVQLDEDNDLMLTDTQVKDILYLREEEKLARDVYEFYYDIFQTRVFQNIGKSEQHHMDMVFNLMMDHVLEGQDPVRAQAGNFTDQTLQAMYTELTQDVTGLVQALLNAALIEETDILDLRYAIVDLKGTQPGLAEVYGRLVRASENHLRAFAGLLEDLQGVNYESQHEDMDQEDVNAILAAGGWRQGGVRHD